MTDAPAVLPLWLAAHLGADAGLSITSAHQHFLREATEGRPTHIWLVHSFDANTCAHGAHELRASVQTEQHGLVQV